MKIVLIENDVALLRTLEMFLKSLGNQVRAFDDPTDACSFLEKYADLDILILDYMMPEFTAPEVLQRVKRHIPEGPKVILISGHTDIIERLDLKEMGVDVFLAKPLDLDLLLEMLQAEELDPARPLHNGALDSET